MMQAVDAVVNDLRGRNHYLLAGVVGRQQVLRLAVADLVKHPSRIGDCWPHPTWVEHVHRHHNAASVALLEDVGVTVHQFGKSPRLAKLLSRLVPVWLAKDRAIRAIFHWPPDAMLVPGLELKRQLTDVGGNPV